MNEYRKDAIDRWYKTIIEKIDGGTLFGEKIDLDDKMVVIVAAYLAGRNEEWNKKVWQETHGNFAE